MDGKKVPCRTCVVTRELLPKKHLLRIVKLKDNTVILDLTGKVNGHGVYIKPTTLAYEKAINTKILQRLLKTNLTQEFYEELKKYCK